jgi:hypothetical protein
MELVNQAYTCIKEACPEAPVPCRTKGIPHEFRFRERKDD